MCIREGSQVLGHDRAEVGVTHVPTDNEPPQNHDEIILMGDTSEHLRHAGDFILFLFMQSTQRLIDYRSIYHTSKWCIFKQTNNWTKSYQQGPLSPN